MNNVALIGYRGTGKTTVAEHLARRLGWSWVDADVELEQEAGCSVAELFTREGEPAFRDRETQVLRRLVTLPTTVLGLGGGVVLRPENRELLAQTGRVVWLKATPETIHSRLAGDARSGSQRPRLTQFGALDEIVRLVTARTPHYQACAGQTVDTEGKTPDAVALEIYQGLPRSLREQPDA